MLSDKDKQSLLKLARNSYENSDSDIKSIPDSLYSKGVTFVSLIKDNNTVNSVGSLFPSGAIFADVVDNANNLSETKLEDVKIEISLIKNMKKLKFDTEEELFEQIQQNIHGVMIEKNKKIATLLPQIWNQIKDKEEFLNQICYKLKLPKDSWKTNAEISTYETETFRES